MSFKFDLGPGAPCDLDILTDTRALIQANSGGGKSHTIRRLLEQTHGRIQQIVIDPEGEFSTLREKGDYVLAARQHGDTIVDPRSAKLLAEKLLQLGVSAILDIYELKAHERVRFVRFFLEALVDAPKALWHPALVVVDEAHVFCPQVGDAESAGAVIDLATRGRKRGYCAVLATQRLSKLHKDAAAECNNKLIGRTGLDVDMKRAADELGLVGREEIHKLRTLEPGEFFAFGPAFGPGVKRIRVGPVKTSHPKAGSRIHVEPPPPTDKVKKLLPQLSDLPAEAEERAKSIEEARKEIAGLKRSLTLAQRGQPTAPPVVKEKTVEKRIEVPVLKEGHLARFEKALTGLPDRIAAALSPLTTLHDRVHGAVEPVLTSVREVAGLLGKLNGHRPPVYRTEPARVGPPVRSVLPAAPPAVPVSAAKRGTPRTAVEGMSRGQQKILNALAELEVLGVDAPSRHQLGMVATYNLTGGTGAQHVADLCTAGLVTVGAGVVSLTDEGRAVADPAAAPSSLDELHQRVFAKLSEGQRRIAEQLIAIYPDAISRADLGAAAGYNLTGGTGAQHVADLVTVGAARIPAPGKVVASALLFPDSLR